MNNTIPKRKRWRGSPALTEWARTLRREITIIEIDGDIYAEQPERDEARTEWFASHGYRVIRFANDDVLHRLDGVLGRIAKERRKTA